MDRTELIAAKGEVQAEIARLRRRQAGLERRGPDADRAAAGLEEQIQALLADEHRLRLLIDRSR